ncbi:MAG: T9SS type A sorting domain-containing protein, partial [Ignavibacteriales bacterium]|nr:T9SS type A sorting domain-containing protein [Ignavibacteriales bacterium]
PAAPGTYSLTFTSGNNYTSINFGNKVAPLTTLPTVDFEDGAVPPPLWTLYNPENDFTWESWSVSAYNIGAKSARVNMFSYSQTGKIDELRSPIVNGYAASDTLVFDYAYAQYSATYVDSFRVQLSYDGGTTYPTSLFYAWGSSLATATTTTSSFVPTGAQWVTKKFPLNAQVVNANVVIKFKTTNGYGNNLYLDNVSVKKATPTGSISGTTFNDANGNGVKDVGESGLANWRIKISGAKIDSTLTNGSGVYTFTSVPAGNFTVSEVVQSGWTQTLPASPGTYSVTLSSGQSVTGKDFGNQAIQYSSISGILFNDLNGNGVKEGGETGLANWRIRLAGAKTDSILTDANGNFSFGNLLQGSYTVSEVQQIGWLQTLPLSPGTYSVNLSSGQNVVNKDFGNQQLGIISGMKFLDANNNGVKDVNEAGLPNWKIKLSGSKTDSTVTNENGNYTFYNLFSGTYFLNEVQQNGWLQTFPVTPGSHTVPLTTGQQITEKNFGNFNPASISGQLFLDINGNGIVNSGEGVLTGWKIKLSGSSTDSTLSDANGNYNFTNLLAGNYVVTEVVQQGWKQTYPASGGNHSLTLSLGQQSSGKNFGNFQLGKVTGKIFHDANSNAIFDDGENVLAGWKVKLSGVRSDSTISDGTGTYLFENLFVGDYSLTLESPSDWTQTTPENISSHNITITESGEIVNGKNFGAFKWGTLSGVVFNDIDGDTLLNEGEEGISDVTVFVRQSETTTPFDSVVTTSNGTFFFDKLPYGSLSFVAFVRHGNDLRKSTNTVTIDVVSGSVNTNRNFAIFYPARISGIKYLDRDADNSFDDNESGIEGATIYLSGTQSVDSVTTDESGLYSFLNVYAGTYTVSSKATFSGGVVSPNEEVSVVSGSEVSNVNFSEYVPATITVRKYIDSDTDSSTIDDRSGKEWTLSVYTGLNADSMIYSANDSIVEVSSVVPGNYSVAESDSIYWKNLMIRVSNNGTPQANNVLSNKTGTRFTVRSGDNYIVSFINTAPDESRYRTFEASNNFALKSQKLSVKNTKPTVANIRDTVVKKINGLTLGLAQTHKDSVKKYGWIYWKKGTDVLKMYTEPHTAGPYPFDSIRLSGKKAKVFLKGLKATRKNYNNTLAEHFGIFKLNVFASAYNITPAGFLQLLYEQPSSIFHGMRLLDIASKLDTVLTRYKVNGDNYNYLAIQDMLIELNKSFATTLSDTDVISLSPLRFDGDRMLREVPFLRRDPTMISRSLPEFEQQNSTVAEDFILNQNYPNPFNPQTAIRFVTNDAGVASLTVFDILGKKIATLLDNTEVEDGEHEIIFNASGLPSGIYYYRLQFSSGEKQSFSETKKLLLLK